MAGLGLKVKVKSQVNTRGSAKPSAAKGNTLAYTSKGSKLIEVLPVPNEYTM